MTAGPIQGGRSEGAHPNLISDTGRTCLEIAIAMDYKEIAELLKKHGAKE